MIRKISVGAWCGAVIVACFISIGSAEDAPRYVSNLKTEFDQIFNGKNPHSRWSFATAKEDDFSGNFTPVTEKLAAGSIFTTKVSGSAQWLAWPNTSADGFFDGIAMMPGVNYDAIAQWQAPKGGRYQISGEVKSRDGDGIILSVFSSDQPFHPLFKKAVNNAGEKFNFKVEVASDARLFFRINRNQTQNFDSNNSLNVAIELLETLDDRYFRSHPKKYILGDDDSTLTMDARGVLMGMSDLVTQTTLINPNQASLAWTLTYKDKDQLSAANYPAPEVKLVSRDLIEFIWKREDSPTIKGRASYDPQKREYYFTVQVDNLTKKVIDTIAFPAEMKIPAEGDNYLMIAGDDKFLSSLIPLKSLSPISVMYPGYMPMQLVGFKVDRSALLIYTDDTTVQVKSYNFTRNEALVNFELSQMIVLGSQKSYQSPYRVVMKAIPHGTYNEMAYEYGKWGRAQEWAKVKTAAKILARPSLDRIYSNGLIRAALMPGEWAPGRESETLRQNKEGGFYEYIKDNTYAHLAPFYSTAEKEIENYEKIYGVKPGYWAPVWAGNYFDTKYPEYFPIPEYMGDFNQLKKWLARDSRPMLFHMNLVHWDTNNPVANDSKYIASWRGQVAEQIWSFTKHRLTNLASSVDYELKTMRTIRDEGSGCNNGVYLDVLGHAFFSDDSENAAYPGKPNSYQLSKLDAFRKVREVIKGPMMTEGRCEFYMPYLDIGFGATGASDDYNFIPLWQLVYGDVISCQPFLSDSDFSTRNARMTIGGIVAPARWGILGKEDGKRGRIYAETTQQKAMRQIMTEKMLRYDRVGWVTVSNWASGIFVWNHSPNSTVPADYHSFTSLGAVAVESLGKNGAVLLTNSKNFSIEGAKSVTQNDELLYTDSSGKLLIVRGDDRLVIHNPSNEAVTAQVKLFGRLALKKDRLSGKVVSTQQVIPIDLKSLSLGPEEFLVIDGVTQ